MSEYDSYLLCGIHIPTITFFNPDLRPVHNQIFRLINAWPDKPNSLYLVPDRIDEFGRRDITKLKDTSFFERYSGQRNLVGICGRYLDACVSIFLDNMQALKHFKEGSGSTFALLHDAIDTGYKLEANVHSKLLELQANSISAVMMSSEEFLQRSIARI